jgi:hypothetical protein
MNRYRNTKILNQPETNIKYYRDTKYPAIPLSITDIYVITAEGDRYDVLAQQYYNDNTLWWIISIANDNLVQNTLYPPAGLQIRIPRDISGILAAYNALNS